MDFQVIEKFRQQKKMSMEDFISLMISFLISSYSAYLSWNCNKNLEIPMKMFYAFFAFMFGAFYLVFYVAVRLGNCGLPK